MGRNAIVTTQAPGVTEAQLVSTEQAFREMAAQVDEQYAAACSLAVQMAYDGPLAVPALLDRLRFYQRRTVDDCLELGKGLVLLKAMSGHGQFLESLNAVGFSERSARRFMSAALKTSKSAKLADLARKASTAGVMLEFLTLDDDEAEHLLDGGTVAGLTYDEADRMTATQLREAFRRGRETDEAKDKVLADKSAKIDKLATEVARLKAKQDQASLLIQVAVADPDAQRDQLVAELSRRASSIEVRLRGDLHLAVGALREHCASIGAPYDADQHIAGALAAIMAAVDEVRAQWGIGEAPTGRHPQAEIWDAIAAEDAMTPADRAVHDQMRADNMVDGMRADNKTDEVIAAQFPAVWAASSYAALDQAADGPVATARARDLDAARLAVVLQPAPGGAK